MTVDDDVVAGCWRLNNVDWLLWTVAAVRGARGGTGGKPDDADDWECCTSLGRIAGGRGGAAAEKDWEQAGLERLNTGLGGTCDIFGGNFGRTCSSSERLISSSTADADSDLSGETMLDARLTSAKASSGVSVSGSGTGFSTSATTVNVCNYQQFYTHYFNYITTLRDMK